MNDYDNDDEKLEALYNLHYMMVSELIEQGYTEIEIAPIMMRVSMEIYKTILSEEDFNEIIDLMSASRNLIKGIDEDDE